MRIVILILTVGISALVASCGGGSGGDGPEGAARPWVQAQIDGQHTAWLDTLRPDQRQKAEQYGEPRDLSDCDLGQAEVLTQEVSPSEAEVTVVFSAPCGHDRRSDGRPYATCSIQLAKLSDRWYVGYSSHCNLSMP